MSPAFVAAGKEARRKDRLAAGGGKRKEDLASIPTPAMVEVKSRSKANNGIESEENAMENPTPAMMAIMQKRQVHIHSKPTVCAAISDLTVK